MKVLRLWALTLGLAIVISSGCGRQVSGEGAVNEFGPMRTHCVGRHLVDLPETFRPHYFASQVTFYYGHDTNFETVDVRVASETISSQQFLAVVEKRAQEILAEINEKTKGPMLVAQERISEDSVLLRYHRSEMSDRSHVHEVHRWAGGAHVLLTAESFKGDMDQVERRLVGMSKLVRKRSETVAAAPEFCLGEVVFQPNNDYEMASLHFRDSHRKHADVAIEIELSSFARDEAEPRLIRRVEGGLLSFGFRPRTLRKGRTELAGAPAEEWLGVRQTDGVSEHMLSLESYPETPSIQNPSIQMHVRTGELAPDDPPSGLLPYTRPTPAPRAGEQHDDASMDDAHVVALFDAIVASLRPRQ